VPFGLFAAQVTPEHAASGPVPIRVVREDGRWYVSPVGTALDVIDNFVQTVDEHTVYATLGLGYLLPPDQTLALNQPTPVTASTRLGRVFAFNGQAGEEVIGEVERSGGQSRYAYLSAEIYTTDGESVDWIDFQQKGGCCGASTVTLPRTGSYRMVVLEYIPADTTITLWDKDRAPKSLVDGDGFPRNGSTCTFDGNVEHCFAEAEPLSPTRLPSQLGTGTATTIAIPTTTSP
jgi:hypothetical protein